LNDDPIPDHLDISLDQFLNIRAPGTYLVKVEGDSMEGAGIFCGDLLIVDKGLSPKAGQVIIGVVNQQPLVKYLAFVGRQTVLRSASRNIPIGSSWKVTTSTSGVWPLTAFRITGGIEHGR
jgi:DNA polymerase V